MKIKAISNDVYKFPNRIERDIGFLVTLGSALFGICILGYNGPNEAQGEGIFSIGICIYAYVIASSVKQFVFLLDELYPGYEEPSIPYLVCCTMVGLSKIMDATSYSGFAAVACLLAGVLCIKHAWDCSYYD